MCFLSASFQIWRRHCRASGWTKDCCVLIIAPFNYFFSYFVCLLSRVGERRFLYWKWSPSFVCGSVQPSRTEPKTSERWRKRQRSAPMWIVLMSTWRQTDASSNSRAELMETWSLYATGKISSAGLLVSMNPYGETYGGLKVPHKNVIYIFFPQFLCGTFELLQSALLWYEKALPFGLSFFVLRSEEWDLL